ncbi:MAG: CBS domain-containing protein [Bdellovibrionaceae bacterium]|nr:CBS domain-containing protein [Pseudobdellovibrionaceae bacterium]
MDRQLATSMVKSPYIADADMDLNDALDYMRECNIRHLPIVESDKLVGIVSERDLKEALALDKSEDLSLRDIMKSEVYTVSAYDSLKDVVRDMAESKYGSAIVVNRKREVQGIFTTIDALRILADLLDKEQLNELVSVEDYIEATRPEGPRA